MINKKKLVKSKGKWIVASYAALAIGLLNVADVNAQTETDSASTATLAETVDGEGEVNASGNESVTSGEEAEVNASETEVESTPDVNHLRQVPAVASDVEVAQFSADKAVDGDDTTRWATNQNVETPTLTLTLPKVTHLERVELKWDQRLTAGTPDPNVNEWRLSYVSSDADTEWKVAHTRTGNPTIEENINLAEAIEAKKLKLEVTNYVKGRLNWRNVGLQEIKAYSNAKISTPDVNHLLNATATASNSESGTTFTGDKAVDGQTDTRWATDAGSTPRVLTLKLAKESHIERIEIDWDQRANANRQIEQDPNVRSWKLYYATSDARNADESTREWQLAHTRRSGEPQLQEIINLESPIDARYLKLEVDEYVAGRLNWQNVGVREIRAFSNPSDAANPTRLEQIESVALTEDGSQVALPELPGEVKLIGSNKTGVIDLTGKVFKPLINQNVKVMLQQKVGTESFTKEFEITVVGKYENEGVGEKPQVVPVVQQWHGVEGKTSITAETVLVADTDNFADAARMYREDLVTRGLTLQEGAATAAKRIEFKKVMDKGYGNEGYGIQINNGVIVIEAATHTGAFYATRTLLQMGENDLQNGEMRDFPSFEHRGFLLDTGRKFVPYHVVVEIMKNMAYYKMNDLQLHLNDNYIFLKEHIKNKGLSAEEELEYVLNNASTGFRVETDVVGANGVALTSPDHYTKEEMKSMIRLAKSLGINLVPEIDTPGHALSFVKVRPDLMYRGAVSPNKHNVERVAMLDLGEKYDETLAFVKSVYEKLFFDEDAPMKDVTTIHIGTDEYYGNAEDYRRYTNEMLQYIKSKGRTPRFWGSLSAKRGTTPVDVTGTELQVWSVGWHRPELALSMGAKVINITDSPTYSVPSGSGSVGGYGDYAGYIQQYNRWTPNDFTTGGGRKFEASNPQIIGGGHAVWNDNIDLHETGITSYDIFKRFFITMTVTAEKTWGSDRAADTFNERVTIPENLKYAPGTNPEYIVNENQLFDITAATLENYVSHNVTGTENGMTFGKESAIATKASAVGPNAVLTIDVTLTGEGVQGFATDGNNAIYLSDQDGKVAYKFEKFHIQFDKTLERGKRYRLTFVTRELGTDLYVDDEKVEKIAQPAHPKLAHTTFVMPLAYILGFEGTLHQARLSKDPYINPNFVGRSEISNIAASSEQLPGDKVENAFDGNRNTLWHSHWTNKEDTYTLDVTLKESTLLKGLVYLPRQSGNNGNITQYEIYVKVNDALTKVAEGTWENNANEKTVTFAPVSTNHIQLKVLAGVQNFASAAEITLLKGKATQETPDNGTTTPEVTTEAQTYSEPTTNISVTFPAGELAAIKGIKANAVAPEQSAQV
ncbi:discoidin domain-containing protein, partial [Aerococcaceae bacterium NML191219]|nr:discoidin domain-containing protein [Aerococcaceae bacterium NML191219]